MYFVKNDSKTVIAYERHRIKIPTLGWVKLKEKGYLPKHDENQIIKSGTVSIKANLTMYQCLLKFRIFMQR